MDHEKMNEPNDPLESALRQFSPRSVFDGGLRSNLDRDRLMFLAGRESERPALTGSRVGWLWPAATFTMSGVAACFAIALGLQLTQPPRERIIVREVPAAQPAQEAIAAAPAVPAIMRTEPGKSSPLLPSFPDSSLMQMRNVALRFGVEALPSERSTSTAAAQPLSPIEPWQQLRDSHQDSDSSL